MVQKESQNNVSVSKRYRVVRTWNKEVPVTKISALLDSSIFIVGTTIMVAIMANTASEY